MILNSSQDSELRQQRAAIKEAGRLIKRLDAMMRDPFATPARLSELKKWQSDLIDNNLHGDSVTITRGVKQVEGYLTDEKKAAEAIQPRPLHDIHKEQAEHYRRANEQRKRDDDRFTRNSPRNQPK